MLLPVWWWRDENQCEEEITNCKGEAVGTAYKTARKESLQDGKEAIMGFDSKLPQFHEKDSDTLKCIQKSLPKTGCQSVAQKDAYP